MYKYGSEHIYQYADTELRIDIELNDGNEFILEYGEDFHRLMFFDGHFIMGLSETETALRKFSARLTSRINLEALFESMEATVDEGYYDLHDTEAKETCEAVERYLKDNPTDTELLLSFAYTALQLLVYSEIDIFDINHTIKKLLQENLEDNFIVYIRNNECNPNDYRDNIGYVNLATTALRLIREAKEETASV